MKIKLVFVLFLLCSGLYYGVVVLGGCPPTWNVISETAFSCSNTLVDKTWRVYWQDGNTSTKGNSAQGQCSGYFTTTECPPRFEEPRSFPTTINGDASEEWAETAYNRRYNGGCKNYGYNTETLTHSCRIYGGGEGGNWECDPYCGTGTPGNGLNDNYIPEDPTQCCDHSPIVIDVLGNGFNLTDVANGVVFDFNGDGVSHRISWTAANSDDAWLVLDRSGNGLIDSAREMFGNITEQSASSGRNGFLALGEYDKAERGGNADGKINQRDEIFSSLRLWQDANHNGISEANEMSDLPALDVRAIELDYRESRRRDEQGNQFKYRAKVRDAQGASVGRWAWDVFLVLEPPPQD